MGESANNESIPYGILFKKYVKTTIYYAILTRYDLIKIMLVQF